MRRGVRRVSREAGFTLVEMLITCAILAFTMAAVVGIYQVTQKSTSYASAGEDAQATARGAIDRLVMELRLLNGGRAAADGSITAASATSITFLGVDLAGSATTSALLCGTATVPVSSTAGFATGQLLTIAPYAEAWQIQSISAGTVTTTTAFDYCYASGTPVGTVRTLTYTYTASGSSGTLTRSVGGVADPPLLANLSDFQLTYWDASTPAVQITDLSSQAQRDLVREIRIQMSTTSLSGDQRVTRTMSVSVRPRNLWKYNTYAPTYGL